MCKQLLKLEAYNEWNCVSSENSSGRNRSIAQNFNFILRELKFRLNGLTRSFQIQHSIAQTNDCINPWKCGLSSKSRSTLI